MKLAFVISASVNGETNPTDLRDLGRVLADFGLSLVPFRSSYQGASESGFVALGGLHDVALMQEIACDFNQIAFLAIAPETQKVYEVFANEPTPALPSPSACIGKWCKIAKKEALEGDYTYFHGAGVYYTVK